jgi:ribosomal protein S18 acetylase RimI-like enzyme
LAEASGAEIRSARAEDVSAVLALWDSAARSASDTDHPGALRALIARDPGALVVAELDGELIGSVIVGWDGWRGTFYRLTVRSEHRRAGLARRLIAAGDARLRELGASRVHVIVTADDLAAVGFWGAVGFVGRPDQLRMVRAIPEPGGRDGSARPGDGEIPAG